MDGKRPGDAYNQRGPSWAELLEEAGWSKASARAPEPETYWTRPGKVDGVSASTNYKGSNLLYIFTTSTKFKAERSYDKFGAYAVLHHDGDWSAAAKTFVWEGYRGDEEDEPVELFRRWTIGELLDEPRELHWTVEGMFTHGTYGPTAGPWKSLKSYIEAFIRIAVAAGVAIFDHFKVPEARPVISYIGEGGRIQDTLRLERIARAMGVRLKDIPLFSSYDVATLDSEKFQRSFERDLEELRPGLFTIDSLYNYHGQGVSAGVLYERGAMLNRLSAPCMEAGCVLSVVDHFKQTGNAFELSQIAWAGVAEWADSWILVKHRSEPNPLDVAAGKFYLELRIGSRVWGEDHWSLDLDIGPFDKQLREHVGEITWRLLPGVVDGQTGRSIVGQGKDSAKRQQVLEIIKDKPGQLTTDDVHDLADGIGWRTVKKFIVQLEANGWIRAEPGERTDARGRPRKVEVWVASDRSLPAELQAAFDELEKE